MFSNNGVLSVGSFGIIASQRQGSPKGTNEAPQPSLGGTVRPTTTTSSGTPGGTLGNISANLPSTSGIKTKRTDSPHQNARAATQVRLSHRAPNWSVVGIGAAFVVILVILVKV